MALDGPITRSEGLLRPLPERKLVMGFPIDPRDPRARPDSALGGGEDP